MLDRSNVRVAVLLDDPAFRFNASHFLTFPIGKEGEDVLWAAEPVHGHDFRACVKIEGPLDESACVVDFIAASKIFRAILDDWDHDLVLAQARGARYLTNGDMTTIQFDVPPKLRYVVPTDSIRWLDVANASTEEIALELLDEFVEALVAQKKLAYAWEAYRFTLRLEEAPNCAVEVTTN